MGKFNLIEIFLGGDNACCNTGQGLYFSGCSLPKDKRTTKLTKTLTDMEGQG